MKEIYTPMEKILIRAAMLGQEEEKTGPFTAEEAQAALKTKEAHTEAMKLDLMLLEAEEKMGLMDGLKMEDWLL